MDFERHKPANFSESALNRHFKRAATVPIMSSYLKYVFGLLIASSVSALVHPGMLHTDDDFTRMKSKVDANTTPWITGWNMLIANSHSSLTYTASPLPIVYRGYDGTQRIK
ncbi:hypothetical protein LOCC1_G008224 [Lachnellula occidentalis]|uniref:Uncharacterized protein n=1 Tax=Lachnellula occidentalis TaxID=215460 RepID=A0A8H8RQ38_9HELO|nr:hypothetical protein LOCC1_G008224 [Lachnellula occidentalis]